MTIYDQYVSTTQVLQAASLESVYHGDGFPVYVFTQPTIGWCPYRKVVSSVRTLKLRMNISESMMRRHLLYNKVYIRAIYGHSPLIKDGEEEYEVWEREVRRQLITEHEQPYIDKFGMYMYIRLVLGTHTQDIDLRYTEDLELEKLYNYDLCDSKPSDTTHRVATGVISRSLVST